MAKVTAVLPTKIEKKIQILAAKDGELIKKAVYDGADILANQVRANLQANLAGSQYSTGALLEAFGVAPIRQYGDSINTKMGFDGYDGKGVPNALKARAMESGTSKQAKRPFMRPAFNQKSEQARAKMVQTFEEEIKKIMD